MTHLPNILAAYAIAIAMPIYLGIEAVFRVRNASRRLQAIDPRRDRTTP